MEELMDVASYIYNRYEDEYGEKIEEAKLQKILYFAQREALVQNRKPLFQAEFYGRWNGPILREIHLAYKDASFLEEVPEEVVNRICHIVNKVFEQYAMKRVESLTRLTRGEISWKNSRCGIPDYVPSDNPMRLEDISKDAKRIRERRIIRTQLGLA